MKILLQQKTTGLYFQRPSLWIRELHAASDFGSSHRAIEHINAECITDVQVVAVFYVGGYVESVCYQVKAPPGMRTKNRPENQAQAR